MKLNQSSRQGFVLLTTLLILAIAGVLSIGLVRHSLNLATTATRAERELQTKWGSISCNRFARVERARLLTENRIEDGEEVDSQLTSAEMDFNLGGQEFYVLLQDESVKLNINHSYLHAGRESTVSAVRNFSGGRLPVQLRPLRLRNRTAMEDDFESWGQVFELDGAGDLPPEQLIAATTNLTFWGQGINLHLASDKVVQQTVAPLVGATMAFRLLEIREEGGLDDWQEQLAAAGAREGGLNTLARIARTSSSAYSVWVVSRSSHKTSASFSAIENVSESVTRIRSF